MLKTAKRIHSLPKYVPGKPVQELERDFGIENAIKLASNENPLGPSPKAKDAIIQAASKSHLYPDGDSYFLKRGIALKEGILPNQIVLGNGSNEVLELIGHCYIEEGDEVLMGKYCFIVYPIVTMLSQGTIVKVDMPNLVHNLSSFKSSITEATKVVFLANPNNPTGTIVSTEEIISLLEFLPEDVLLVVDEAYSEYVESKYRLNISTIIKKHQNLLVLKTFSKMYGIAGLRVGYAMGSEELISNLERAREPFNVNIIAQEAALASLEDDEHVARSIKVNNDGMLYLKTEISKLGLKTYPSYANFLLVEFPLDATNIYEELLKHGVIVRPLKNYNLSNCLRVTIGTREENEKFLGALKKVLGSIK